MLFVFRNDWLEFFDAGTLSGYQQCVHGAWTPTRQEELSMDLDRLVNGLVESGIGGARDENNGGLSHRPGRSAEAPAGRPPGKAALVGGLAGQAYSRYRDSGLPIGRSRSMDSCAVATSAGWNVAPPPTGAGFLIVRAMIDAAKCDGHIDAREQQRIFSRIAELDLSAEEKLGLLEALRRPGDMQAIVDQVHRLEDAAEVYMAALLAVDRTSPAAQRYLKRLATRLNLPDLLVVELTLAADDRSLAPSSSREPRPAPGGGGAAPGTLR